MQKGPSLAHLAFQRVSGPRQRRRPTPFIYVVAGGHIQNCSHQRKYCRLCLSAWGGPGTQQDVETVHTRHPVTLKMASILSWVENCRESLLRLSFLAFIPRDSDSVCEAEVIEFAFLTRLVGL